MKIKLAIVENDENYVKRLLNNFQANYADKIEAYAFSDYEMFTDFCQSRFVHVVLVSEKMSVKKEAVASDISFAWLVSDNAIREWEGYPAVGKYQKAELLYKEVLSLYADLEGKLAFRNGSGGKCILFTSAQGGAGTSVMAAACALHMGKAGRKVIYLNFDRFGKPELYFQGQGSAGFSDVIYALKSKNGKLPIKLESIARRDSRGVSFFASCKNANDMLEMNVEDAGLLLDAVKEMEDYEYIVIDMPLDFSPICSLVMEKHANTIIFLCDGSDIGNEKLQNVCEIIKALPQKSKGSIFTKGRLLYNQNHTGSFKEAEGIQMEAIGKVDRKEAASSGQLADALKDHPVVARIEV